MGSRTHYYLEKGRESVLFSLYELSKYFPKEHWERKKEVCSYGIRTKKDSKGKGSGRGSFK